MNDAESPRTRINRAAYEANPRTCRHCGAVLPFEKRMNSYCDHSCRASYVNRGITRHYKHSDVCECGNKKLRHNKYCAECIQKQVYNLARSTENMRLEDCKSDKTRRKWLLERRGQRCESCGLTEWMGQPIAIDLHHVDGDTDNNTEENLKLLCPNCHALSHTYKRRNKTGKRQLMRRQRYDNGQTW